MWARGVVMPLGFACFALLCFECSYERLSRADHAQKKRLSHVTCRVTSLIRKRMRYAQYVLEPRVGLRSNGSPPLFLIGALYIR